MAKFVREHVCKKENPISLLYFLKEKLVIPAFTRIKRVIIFPFLLKKKKVKRKNTVKIRLQFNDSTNYNTKL